jgi:hypothetical protein
MQGESRALKFDSARRSQQPIIDKLLNNRRGLAHREPNIGRNRNQRDRQAGGRFGIRKRCGKDACLFFWRQLRRDLTRQFVDLWRIVAVAAGARFPLRLVGKPADITRWVAAVSDDDSAGFGFGVVTGNCHDNCSCYARMAVDRALVISPSVTSRAMMVATSGLSKSMIGCSFVLSLSNAYLI